MIYLFNDSADQKTAQKDIWLTGEGNPVLVSKLGADFGSVPKGGQLVGKIDSADSSRYQLTDKGNLTQTGVAYCEIMGVEESAASLTRFVTTANAKTTQVKVDSVIAKSLNPA